MKTTLHPTFACPLVNTNLPIMMATVRNGRPRQAYVNVRHPVAKIPVDVLPCTYQTEMAKQMDCREKQTPQMARVPEDLKGWGAWGITCGFKVHCAIDRLEERGVKRGTARRSSLRGRKQPIVSQSNCGAIPYAKLRKHLTNELERRWAFPVHRYHLELNWTDLEKTVTFARAIVKTNFHPVQKQIFRLPTCILASTNTHSLYYLRQTWILFISYKP